ncbi:MAG: MATE family efflux transporter, partial [Lachnospiraceae bacterium]
MSQSISQEFKFVSLLKFAFPSMVMMVFMSLYTIVDGIFISRLLGSNALSAANIIYPVLSILIAVGIMLATGGSAIVATKMGEKKEQEARQNFSLITVTALIFGILSLIFGNLFITEIVKVLGATELLLKECEIYLGVLLLFALACVLQLIYQCFFVTAGKPGIGLAVTILGGITNAALDYLLMGPFQMGIAGAAVATGMGQLIPAIVGTVYFFFVKKDLYFVKPKMDKKVLFGSCTNGSSEMVTNLANAVITYLFNMIMLKLLGEDGVAAITIVLYGQFLFNALYMGFS